jgi:biopolymer transport protein TolR
LLAAAFAGTLLRYRVSKLAGGFPMAFSASRNNAPDINVTPLIDVLLVLLIICMIITPLVPKGLDAVVPAPAKEPASVPEQTVVLQLARNRDGQPLLRINQQAVSWDDLHAKLVDIYKQRSDHAMFVQGERDIEFTYVAEAIDIAHQSGVDRVGLMK